MSKQPPPAPTASAVGPCPTVIQIVGRPGTGRLPSTIAPPDQPLLMQMIHKKGTRADLIVATKIVNAAALFYMQLLVYSKKYIQVMFSKLWRDN